MDTASDRMVEIASIPLMHHPRGRLPVHRDYGSVLIGAWRLDLDGIGQLQVALDRAVEAIRAYQDRQAADNG